MFNNLIFTNLEIDRWLIPGNPTYPEFSTTPIAKSTSIEIASIDRHFSKSTVSHIGIPYKMRDLLVEVL